jgi:hypothetical protein
MFTYKEVHGRAVNESGRTERGMSGCTGTQVHCAAGDHHGDARRQDAYAHAVNEDQELTGRAVPQSVPVVDDNDRTKGRLGSLVGSHGL